MFHLKNRERRKEGRYKVYIHLYIYNAWEISSRDTSEGWQGSHLVSGGLLLKWNLIVAAFIQRKISTQQLIGWQFQKENCILKKISRNISVYAYNIVNIGINQFIWEQRNTTQ